MIALKQKRHCPRSYRVAAVTPPLKVRTGKKHYVIKRGAPMGAGTSLSNQLSVLGN